MSRVTSKLQVTIPKKVATAYGIEPGSDITFEPAGSTLRVVVSSLPRRDDLAWRMRLFDEATERQEARNRASGERAAADRGWTRASLYTRGDEAS